MEKRAILYSGIALFYFLGVNSMLPVYGQRQWSPAGSQGVGPQGVPQPPGSRVWPGGAGGGGHMGPQGQSDGHWHGPSGRQGHVHEGRKGKRKGKEGGYHHKWTPGSGPNGPLATPETQTAPPTAPATQ